MKKDVLKNREYIRRLIAMVKSYIPPKKIPPCVPRRSDAFVLILAGSCQYEFDDGDCFEARLGDLLYLAKGAVYKMNVLERYEFICADFFFDGEEARKSALVSFKDSKDAENLFRKLLRQDTERPESHAEAMSLLYGIYATAIRARETHYLSGSTRSVIEGARARILRDFASADLTVASLASDANMSEVHFRTRFKELYGTPPAAFINGCRIAHAKELLSLNYLSLEEIAESCGFSSASYLCRVFKQYEGITAAQYRKDLLRIFDT